MDSTQTSKMIGQMSWGRRLDLEVETTGLRRLLGDSLARAGFLRRKWSYGSEHTIELTYKTHSEMRNCEILFTRFQVRSRELENLAKETSGES